MPGSIPMMQKMSWHMWGSFIRCPILWHPYEILEFSCSHFFHVIYIKRVTLHVILKGEDNLGNRLEEKYILNLKKMCPWCIIDTFMMLHRHIIMSINCHNLTYSCIFFCVNYLGIEYPCILGEKINHIISNW